MENEREDALIPYYVHEGVMCRMERNNKRWFIAFLIVLLMLFATNGAWVIYEMQYQEETYTFTIEQDSADGNVTYNGRDVNIGGEYYGQANNHNDGQAAGD